MGLNMLRIINIILLALILIFGIYLLFKYDIIRLHPKQQGLVIV